ncbi:DUF559 domain-containing protein [Nocardioides sp. KC13]|uniref:DUF559 domain-containing protein n=1 Tax=Nocardioides turkmenicus TaxID=2711220 RepID=A0A6M1R740_9ACTN|nr:DUF559 domain-containing protein [Nocardioides sp. KC13]NGN95432.1 DUF559 domain-containing protein [Nocardioides sp. KC13]
MSCSTSGSATNSMLRCRPGVAVALTGARVSLPGLPDDKSAALALGGVVSGLSAARVWCWSLKHEPTEIEVTVARNRSRKARPGVVVRRRDLPSDAIGPGAITSRARTVVDCARILPLDEALCVADSALRDGLATGLTRDDLVAAAESLPRTGRRRALEVVALADPRAANAFESVTRAIVLPIAGLSVTPQGDLGFSEAGAEQYGDLVDARLELLIECESWAYHAGDEPFRRDIRRYTDLVARGWTVLRFVWEDVMQRPDYVRRQVERVVDRLSAAA